MGQPSSFTLVEMTGSAHNLELTGRALPYRPLPFEGKMRAEVTWYPGSPVGSVQMLGSEEGPSTISGMWKDRFLKGFTDAGVPILFGQDGYAKLDGVALADVFSIVRAVDGFRCRGQLLEMGWDEHVRQGIMTNFRHKWLRREDVEWEMEFQWISKGEPITPVAFAFSIPGASILNAIIAAVQELKDAIQDIKDAFSAVTAIINAIDDAITAIEQVVSDIADIVKKAEDLVLTPLSEAQQLKAAFETVKDKAKVIEDTLRSLPGRAMREVSDVATITQSEAVQSEDLARAARAKARALRAQAAQQQQSLGATSTNQPPLSIFTARDGQDLRDVSRQFYGTPDQWRQLASYNAIHGSKLTAGQVVVVPKMSEPGV